MSQRHIKYIWCESVQRSRQMYPEFSATAENVLDTNVDKSVLMYSQNIWFHHH